MNLKFGPFVLQYSQVFFESSHSLAIVNLKPIVPGHVLIIPKRVEPRLCSLSNEEFQDLFETVRLVSPVIENHYTAEAINVAIQDGAAAGQSVPHVHVHLLPRKRGDFKRNDDVYDELEQQHLNEEFSVDPNKERRSRTLEEMANEASVLRALFIGNK